MWSFIQSANTYIEHLNSVSGIGPGVGYVVMVTKIERIPGLTVSYIEKFHVLKKDVYFFFLKRCSYLDF